MIQSWRSGLADVPEQNLHLGLHKASNFTGYFDLGVFKSMCQPSWEDFGLPSPEYAYLEAASARTPVTAHRWSHPIVYHAGAETGWFELRNRSDVGIKKLFERNYMDLVAQLAMGRVFPAPEHPALENKGTPASKEARERFRAERLARVGF